MDHAIYEWQDRASGEVYYFSFHDKHLIVSLNHALVESSIQHVESGGLARSHDFLEVRKKAANRGLLRVYVNYPSLYKHLEQSYGEAILELKTSLPFVFSGFYLDVENESFSLDGSTSHFDSLESFANLLTSSGKGTSDISSLAPVNTSVYASLGFSSFSRFYEALHAQLSDDEELGEDYAAYTRRAERFLDIDIERDLVEWVADEIAMIQMDAEGGESQLALVFKGRDAEESREKMAFLSRQVRKKTPVRFRTVTYRGHEINFMSVKGFFSLMLGKLFQRFDRPYYTIIDKYVVFSNQPQTLRYMIDQWHSGSTLANASAFGGFMNGLGQRHSGLLYMQPPLLRYASGGVFDDAITETFRRKKRILGRFPQVAFNAQPDGDLLQTKLLLSMEVVNPAGSLPASEFVPAPGTADLDSAWRLDPGEQVVLSDIGQEDATARKQTETFEESKVPKSEVGLKNGKRHGHYFEYFVTGELKVKGKYRNGKKEGVWRYYDENGQLVRKEKYNEDERVN